MSNTLSHKKKLKTLKAIKLDAGTTITNENSYIFSTKNIYWKTCILTEVLQKLMLKVCKNFCKLLEHLFYLTRLANLLEGLDILRMFSLFFLFYLFIF